LLAFIEEALSLTSIEDIEKYMRKNDALDYMQKLWQLLSQAGYEKYLAIDFTLSSHMSYYTGMLFEVFADGSGFPLGNGGRYDGLLEHFGMNIGATGFGLRIDRLLEAMPREEQKQKPVLVLFKDINFQQALQKANELRQQNEKVTLQSLEGLQDVEAFKAHYTNIYDFTSEEA
ncbi:MAG: ATP phosphoribosyltransferase regulatory subunit, partial [Lysinibacillus sp.]